MESRAFNSQTHLRQTRITGIHHSPAELNNLSAILGDIDSVLVACRGDVDDAVLVELRASSWCWRVLALRRLQLLALLRVCALRNR